MEKNPNMKNLVMLKVVSRPQESYSFAPLNFSSSKNMGLSIAIIQTLILTFVFKRLFIWQSISRKLTITTVARTFIMRKRVT